MEMSCFGHTETTFLVNLNYSIDDINHFEFEIILAQLIQIIIWTFFIKIFQFPISRYDECP